MPFQSKAQQKWMFAAEERGEVKKGTARRWAKHTASIKSLPERILKRMKKPKKWQSEATYRESRKGLAKETIKGIPVAASKILKRLLGTKYGKRQNIRTEKSIRRVLKGKKGVDREKIERLLKKYK